MIIYILYKYLKIQWIKISRIIQFNLNKNLNNILHCASDEASLFVFEDNEIKKIVFESFVDQIWTNSMK